jgi:hypothetical protein
VVLAFSGKPISSLTFSDAPCGTTGDVILPFVCAKTGTPIIEIKITPIVEGRINIPGSIVGIKTIRYIKCNLRTNKIRSII